MKGFQLTPFGVRRVALTVAFVAAAVVGLAATAASAQTGSRLGQSSYAETIYWFGAGNEIGEIRTLLQDGRNKKALKVARQFVNHLKGSQSFNSSAAQYYGLNALCVALTVNGKLDEAVRVCDKAVALDRTNWQAFNSRGTAHFVADRFEDALRDYQQALRLDPESADNTGLIERNIGLAESKLASR